MRLDLNTFVVTGPSTKSTSDVLITGGTVIGGGAAASVASQCLTDTFSVSSPGASNPPVICGTNSGEHSEQIFKSVRARLHVRFRIRISVRIRKRFGAHTISLTIRIVPYLKLDTI
jgi:hypothetical protein